MRISDWSSDVCSSDLQIAATERSGRVHNVVTIRTPVGGVVKMLGVREGMTLAPGQTLAEVNGLGTVWVNADIPEAQGGGVRVGAPARVTVTALPDETFTGRVPARESCLSGKNVSIRLHLG